MPSVITLTSDFGLCDGYVASMKGVILGINPQANIVDISHLIKPQDIHQAAFVLGTTVRHFPPQTIHLVVVDPGVGTDRPALIVKTAFGYFVTPDNGSLSYLLKPYLKDSLSAKSSVSVKQGFKEELSLEVIKVTKSDFIQSNISNTFHGRDIFAPLAAYLSLGSKPADFGEQAETIEMLSLSSPQKNADGSLTGHIIHTDNYGNLITDITSADISQKRDSLVIEMGNERIKGISNTYAEGKGLLACIGSSGYLEIAVKNGSAASLLAVKTGDAVKLSS
ncbi:MAG TPA: S-adenosyl-l-methionine hydroxide adenosyltransferase [Dehalococcoidia bacterium]|nr:S-adenosyl-l-methionine hydroxide adenosyltransferase [Dehalococcoidia bacterium]